MSVFEDTALGLKANIDAAGLGVNCTPYPRSNPHPPLIHLWPSSVPTYHGAMQVGVSEAVFTVQLVWNYVDDAAAAFAVYDFLDSSGGKSVLAAIESDKTLGGVCDRLQVQSSSGLNVSVTIDNIEKMTADWLVRIWF